jgi:hypothetical protein
MSLLMNCSRSRRLRYSVLLIVLLLSPAAFASLGGNLDSLQADRSKMNASVRTSELRSYAVHEMTTPHGTVVREYVSSEGRVFGVAWQGPFIPDMRQLLGSYFSRFSAAAREQQATHVGRRFLVIRDANLVLETSGRMLSYSGRAFDPSLLPQGVTSDDIR